MPFLSICIPAYKHEEGLQRLLESIRSQNYRDFEVVLTDDSPDDRLKVLSKKFENDFPLLYIKNEVSKGSPGNWNFAMSQAKGQWIKLMHHDDWFTDDEALGKFARAAEGNPDARFFFCGTRIFDTRVNQTYTYHPSEKTLNALPELPAGLFHANVIGAPTTTLVRKPGYEFYDPALIWLVDIECYFRSLIKHGYVHIDEPLIITAAEQESQLTHELKGNKSIELFEYFYCYAKLKPQLDSMNRAVFQQKLLFLLQDFDVRSLREIRKAGFTGKIPGFIHGYCLIAGFSQKLAIKIFGKWLQTRLNENDSN